MPKYQLSFFHPNTEELMFSLDITREQYKMLTGLKDPDNPETWGEYPVEAFAGVYEPVK